MLTGELRNKILYEHMLSKIASAGQNGQFRTPRHIIALMVEMMAPGPKDTICDPAAGTCGFLVAAGEYLRDNHPEIFRDEALRRHFHEGMFHGFDFDGTMLRIGSMNMLLHVNLSLKVLRCFKCRRLSRASSRSHWPEGAAAIRISTILDHIDNGHMALPEFQRG